MWAWLGIGLVLIICLIGIYWGAKMTGRALIAMKVSGELKKLQAEHDADKSRYIRVVEPRKIGQK
jgi:hypothetical protein